MKSYSLINELGAILRGSLNRRINIEMNTMESLLSPKSRVSQNRSSRKSGGKE